MSEYAIPSSFGEIRVDSTAAEKFLVECGERVKAGEELDREAVLDEARSLIAATLHPRAQTDEIEQPGDRSVPAPMKNKTRELLDFANEEPLAVADMTLMLREMDEDAIDHVEQVANNLLLAIGRIDQVPQGEFDK